MKLRAHHRCGSAAAGMFAVALVGAQQLVAQGGANTGRGILVAADVPVERSSIEPARSIVRNLVGTWRFEIRFAGNFDGPPDASGTRIVKALYDDLRVEWTEEVDHSPMRGQGVIGFDARSDRFFSTSVYNAGSGAEVMTGVLAQGEPLITFTPITLAPGGQTLTQSTALSLLDPDHFTWAALDRGWRAVFTRQKP